MSSLARCIGFHEIYSYALFTKREVKMAGYRPSSFAAFLWTSTQCQSIKTHKMNEVNIQLSWPNKLGQKRTYIPQSISSLYFIFCLHLFSPPWGEKMNRQLNKRKTKLNSFHLQLYGTWTDYLGGVKPLILGSCRGLEMQYLKFN